MMKTSDHQDMSMIMPTGNRPANQDSAMSNDASRLDAVAKVTGSAKYSRDRYLPDSLFATMVRCPYGKAELVSIDTNAAERIPGVVEVTVEPRTCNYQGQNVGVVVGESRTAVRRGLRALNCRWRRETASTGIADEIDGVADVPGRAQRTLDSAPHVLRATYTTPVVTHSALETHGAVVDHRGDSATVYISTQGTASASDGIGRDLNLPGSKFEIDCEYVGGGFGAKLGGPGKEGSLAARMAAKYQRPVHVFLDRDEEHLDTGNRPSSRTDVAMAIDTDGTILGGHIQTYGGSGVAGRGGGVSCPSGRYDLGQLSDDHQDIKFNAGWPKPFRAPGQPQGAFAEELMLDELATMAGTDPLALRITLDKAAHRREMFEMVGELIGWKDRRTTGSQTGTLRRGYGLGSCSWGRYPADAGAEAVIYRDGSVEMRTGTQDIGTGMRTVAGVLTAEYLGVPLDRIQVGIGSSKYPPGPASGGSMTSHNTAPAIMQAAAKAKMKLLEMQSNRDGGDVSEYDLREGIVYRGDEQVATFEQLCSRINGESITARGSKDRAAMAAYGGEGHSHGVQAVELDVDTDTGVIHLNRIIAIQSCGRVVCRKTAESQIIGGVIQGLSYALFEDKMLDKRSGSMVNPNLEWYRIAGPNDMPHIEPILWTKGQTGVRSLGEPPIIPTAGAIACAVFNAIGAPVRDLPLRPDRVLAAMEKGGRS